MTIDDAIMKALKGGGRVTVKAVASSIERRVRIRLERLRVRGVVVREGKGVLIASSLTN